MTEHLHSHPALARLAAVTRMPMNTTLHHPDTTSRSSFRFLSFAAAALMCCLPSLLPAQPATGTVTGRVLNHDTGQYVKFAQIQVVGSGNTTLSEADGSYSLVNVPAGETRIACSYTGLGTVEAPLAVPAGGSVVHDFDLSSTEGAGNIVTLSEFKVSGAREGNAKAIVEQRVAVNLKTVVASDAFGDVAEGNIGEFLKLLPGVTVDYNDNDVRSTRIRGLPPKYSTTTLDGLPIANSGSNNLNVATGRWLELEQVSMAALDILETAKTPTSDSMGLNLAGNVNAISRSAFNQKGRSINYQASVNLNQWNLSPTKSEGWDNKEHSKALPGGTVRWTDTLLDGRLGMVMSVSHSGAYAEQRVTIGTQIWDRNPDNNNSELPVFNNWNFQHGLKPTWRDSLLLNFDFKATEELKLSLRTNYGYYWTEFYNRNWLVQANTTGLATYDPNTGLLVPSATPGLINRTTTSAESLASATSRARVLGSNQRKSGGTLNVSPAATWKRDNLKLEIAGAYSIGKTAYTSGQDGFFSLVQADMQNVGWSYERVSAGDVVIRQQNSTGANQGSVFDLGNYTAGGQVNSERRNGKDQIWSGRADAEIDFSGWRVPSTFKFGLATSLEVRDVENLQARWTMTLTNGATTSTAINLRDYQEGFSNKVGTVTDISGTTAALPSTDKWRLYDLFQSYANTDPFSLNANGPFRAQAANNLRYMLQNQADLKETINAAYAMATIKPVSRLTVIAGLRFEGTKTKGRAFDDIGRTRASAIAGTSNTNDLGYIYARYGSRITREKSYDDILPVLQGRYELSKRLVARGAYYSSILRPDFQSVMGGVTATDNPDGSYAFAINNTSLKPESAHNFDLALDYYFEPVGIISASLFYKDIKNIQINRPATTIPSAPVEIQEQLTAAGYTASDPGFTHVNTTVTGTVNGPNTSIWGYELAYSQELSFLPPVLKGFTLTTNFSHYEPEEKRLWALVPNAGDGMSLNQGNIILRYRRNKFSGGITATWTEKRLWGGGLVGLTVNEDGTFAPITTANNSNVTGYQSGRWIYSLSGEYALHRYATLFMGVNNALNSALFRYNEQESFTLRNGSYGASINVGIKGSF